MEYHLIVSIVLGVIISKNTVNGQQSVNLTVSPPSTATQAGETAKFRCTFSGSWLPGYNLQWLKGETPIAAKSSTDLSDSFVGRFSLTLDTPGDIIYTLIITDIEKNDTGLYNCQFSTGTGVQQNATARLDVDLDVCENNNCSVNAICASSLRGGYTCTCNNEYTGDGFTCTDIDECSEDDLNECSLNETCLNSVGSYQCQCSPGFNRTGPICTVITADEILANNMPLIVGVTSVVVLVAVIICVVVIVQTTRIMAKRDYTGM